MRYFDHFEVKGDTFKVVYDITMDLGSSQSSSQPAESLAPLRSPMIITINEQPRQKKEKRANAIWAIVPCG